MTRAQDILERLDEKGWVYKPGYNPTTGVGKYVTPLGQFRGSNKTLQHGLTGLGVARGGQALLRVKRAHTDKIRQAGHGDAYDAAHRELKVVKSQAKQDHKDGNITGKERKKAVEAHRDKIDDIAQKGHAKYAQMMKGTTMQQRQSIAATM